MKDDIKYLFIKELEEMLDAEHQLKNALSKVVAACDSPDLKAIFESYLINIQEHEKRLEMIFTILKVRPQGGSSAAGMRALIQECIEVITAYESSPIRDAALICKTQRIKHYEIAAYTTLRTLAKELDLAAAIDLLDETLLEVSKVDKKLIKIAEGGLFTAGINKRAHRI